MSFNICGVFFNPIVLDLPNDLSKYILKILGLGYAYFHPIPSKLIHARINSHSCNMSGNYRYKIY